MVSLNRKKLQLWFTREHAVSMQGGMTEAFCNIYYLIMVFFHREGAWDTFFFSRESILYTRDIVDEVDDFCCWVILLLFCCWWLLRVLYFDGGLEMVKKAIEAYLPLCEFSLVKNYGAAASSIYWMLLLTLLFFPLWMRIIMVVLQPVVLLLSHASFPLLQKKIHWNKRLQALLVSLSITVVVVKLG